MTRAKSDEVRSLTVRLLGLLTVALFPLALISLYQTQAVVDEAEALSRTALLAETERFVSEEREHLKEAFGAAQALGAAMLEVGNNTRRCQSVMARFTQDNPAFAFAGFVPPTGRMVCTSTGETFDFATTRDWTETLADIRLRLRTEARDSASGLSILTASHPVYGPAGFAGFVSIAVQHEVTKSPVPKSNRYSDFWLVTLNRSGEILASSGEMERAGKVLPADISNRALFTRVNEVFDAPSAGGKVRKYTVIPVFDGAVHAVGSWPIGSEQGGILTRNVSAPLALPILMWLVGIAVAWLGLSNLVIRHIRALRDAMRRFALGERGGPQLALANPPQELAEVERAFNRMVRILTESEARRDADLHDKTVLLREVHHRVKNNLQLIASITNLQMRHVQTPETRRVLEHLQRRIRGLATIHQRLYSTPDLTTIDAKRLVESLVEEMDLIGGRTELAPNIETDLESAMLYPDQAVPLSMFLAEALTNAWKYAGTNGTDRPDLSVSLKHQDSGHLRLCVENSRPLGNGVEDDMGSDGLGQQLMHAFVVQLDGTSNVEEGERFYRLTLDFKPSDWSAASTG